MQLNPGTILHKRAGVVSRALDDARIALRLDRSETLVFNGSASELWDLFDGVHTLAEVAAETGMAPAEVNEFAAELLRLELFSEIAQPMAGAARATARKRSEPATEKPQLLAREDLAVMGGCSSSSVACSTPSSTFGNGNGNGVGPKKPPPGQNKP